MASSRTSRLLVPGLGRTYSGRHLFRPAPIQAGTYSGRIMAARSRNSARRGRQADMRRATRSAGRRQATRGGKIPKSSPATALTADRSASVPISLSPRLLGQPCQRRAFGTSSSTAEPGHFFPKLRNSADAGFDSAWNDMGQSLGDYAGDGDSDVYITNINRDGPSAARRAKPLAGALRRWLRERRLGR